MALTSNTLTLRATNVFERTAEALAGGARIVVNQGGSRSSKTYSVLQLLLIRGLEQAGRKIDVCRKTLPALRYSAMSDFWELLHEYDLYDVRLHNRTENIYRLPNGSEIRFFGLDQAQKIRGRKRDDLFINEANELSSEDWRQLRLRTTGNILLDYNPSDQFHWIYEQVLTRNDVELLTSTYLDNPFLEPVLRAEIEMLKEQDEEAWRVYGLGLRGVNEASIYKTWSLCDYIPEDAELIYGLDVGFTAPTALVEVGRRDAAPKPGLYINELVYERGLNDDDLLRRLEDLQIDKRRIMYVDSAAAATIETLRRAGYQALASDKDVVAGLRTVRRHAIHVTKRSANVQKEIRKYKNKTDTKTGQVLEEPVKFDDHAMDALRYATHTRWGPLMQVVGGYRSFSDH